MITISLPSLESVYIELFRGELRLATGSAFLCENGGQCYLVSNWHNFAGRNNETGHCLSSTLAVPNIVRAFLCSAQSIDQTIPYDFPLLNEEEEPLWCEHPVHGAQVDVAALPVVIPQEAKAFPVSWKNPIGLAVRIGLPAKVIGYPFGRRINQHLPVWANGYIASEPDIDVDGLPLMLVDCRTRRGHSGSPVILHYPRGMAYVHEDGAASVSPADVMRLLGIYSGRISVGSDIGRVWKRTAVCEILE